MNLNGESVTEMKVNPSKGSWSTNSSLLLHIIIVSVSHVTSIKKPVASSGSKVKAAEGPRNSVPTVSRVKSTSADD